MTLLRVVRAEPDLAGRWQEHYYCSPGPRSLTVTLLSSPSSLPPPPEPGTTARLYFATTFGLDQLASVSQSD